MNFYEELQTFVNQQVQVFLPVDTVIGTLVSADANVTTVRTNGTPGYAGTQEVMIVTGTIAYVRIA